MGTIAEKLGSGEMQGGETSQSEKLYVIQGITDEAEALTLLAATAPSIYNELVRKTVRVSPVDRTSDIWIGEVEYVSPEDAEKPEGESETVRFTISGSPQHITQAISTSGAYVPAAKVATDYKDAINVVDSDGSRTVAGIDINVSLYKWTERHIISAANMTEAYVGRLKEVADHVNNATFRNHPAGTVYFAGADGSKRSDGAWDVTFDFAHSANVTGRTIGTIKGIAKKGWEYLWVAYREAKDAASGLTAMVPRQVNVNKVYNLEDFGKLEPGYTP